MGCEQTNSASGYHLGQTLTRPAVDAATICAYIQGCLVCPDDIGMIRATLSNTVEDIPGVAGLVAGTSTELTLPALGLQYCLSLGLEQSNALIATDNYRVDILRGGTIVSRYTRQELIAGTANSQVAASCPCSTCVGMVQPVVFRVTNTGVANWAAGATLAFKVCRDFGPMPPVLPSPAAQCQPGKRC